MKKNLALILALCVCLAMYGCAGDTGNPDKSETQGKLFPLFKDVLESENEDDEVVIPEIVGGMELIGYSTTQSINKAREDVFCYYRDLVTDVMYVAITEQAAEDFYLNNSSVRKSGLTVMVDPETGLPLTYSRYLYMTQSTSKED